ncbi:MAG: glycosyltransferase family 2 protein [Cyanophyceae cyanobacterium]
MDISIIIPVYNGEGTILETLESIWHQSIDFSDTKCEVIIVNDGSTDKTAEVVEAFISDNSRNTRKKPSVQLVTTQNQGVSKARNQGATLAKGQYLTFIDADDLWTIDKLEAQYLALEYNPRAGFVYSWINSINLNGDFFRRGGYPTVSSEPWIQLLIIDVVESGSNVMIRRNIFEAVGGFDEALTHSEDWDLWIRLAEKSGVITVPSPQILYRQGGTTASTNVRKMEAGSLEIITREAKKFEPNRHHIVRQSLANRYKILAFEAMDSDPSRGQAWLGFKYGVKAIFYDKNLISQGKNIAKFFIKCAAIWILPQQNINSWLERRQDWEELEQFFLASIQVNF